MLFYRPGINRSKPKLDRFSGKYSVQMGWSPFEGIEFSHKVVTTFINGNPVFENGEFKKGTTGKRLEFDV